MIFAHKATSGMMTILSKWKRKTLEGATSEPCSRTMRSHIARNYHVLWRENVACIEPDMCPEQPGFKSHGYDILGPCTSESTTAGSLTPLIRWSRRSCWSDTHCHGASFIIASVNGNVVCSVSWQTHWTHVSLAGCTVNLLLLQTLCWKYFME